MSKDNKLTESQVVDILSGNAPASITEPKTRRKAMFFEKVGGYKEIPFGKTLVLNKGDYFTTGKLISKTETEDSFQYLFADDQQAGESGPEEFDYWLLPVVS